MFLGPQMRIMTLFPQFHASGIIGALFFQLFLGTTVVYAPTAVTPGAAVETVANAFDILGDAEKIDVLALPPPHMEYLGANPDLLDRVSGKVTAMFWSGGDLSLTAGNAIAPKTRLFNHMASTEVGLWTALQKTGSENTEKLERDWQYLSFHPALNIRFDAVSESVEGTIYEAIMVKNGGESAWVQPIFKIHTAVEQISLGDLYTQHPKDPEMWKHYGRADDLLNFLTGETFHPRPAEQRIAAHPGVVEVLLVGTRRPKASLIVRLGEHEDLDDVWNVIDEVNKDSPVYARVARHMILAVPKPFLKTAKGTVQRKTTLELYEKELDMLYEKDGSLVPVR
jgi:acyl-CoA synthetase (AMP-forming)/AMP-acid ligase II